MFSATVSQHRPLVVLLGPTAVGKSRIAVKVAKVFETEVLAADSRQVYRGMDIGTDKPTIEERQGVLHRLIDLVDPDVPFNTGWYRQAALEEIGRLHQTGRLPFVVGGTGLYIRTLVRGLCQAPQADPSLRAEFKKLSDDQGPGSLYAELQRIDPDTAGRLHPNDESKIIRALEVHRLSGRSISAVHREHQFQDAPFPTLLIGLQRSRVALYEKIEQRIDWQLAHGMVEETRALLDRGYGRQLGAMKGLGYRQVAAYLANECRYDDMVDRFKRDTRRFAKRQMTWFRKEPGIVWVSVGEQDTPEQTTGQVVGLIERFLHALEQGTQPDALGKVALGT